MNISQKYTNPIQMKTNNINGTNDNDINDATPPEPILDSEITYSELQEIIGQLNANRSPGPDGLTAEVFKSSFDLLSPFIVKFK